MSIKTKIMAGVLSLGVMSGMGIATAGGAAANPNPVRKGQSCYTIYKYEGLVWHRYKVWKDYPQTCWYEKYTQIFPGVYKYRYHVSVNKI